MNAPAWLDSAILTWGYWAVLFAVMIESMGVPFPGETSLLAAAIYAGTGRSLDIVVVIVAASVGAILGDNVGYAVGRYGGYPFAQRILTFFHVKLGALEAAQDYFARHGDKTVFIGRFFALLRITVAFMAGVTVMPWRRFLVWNALGGIAWATLYGVLGFILGRHLTLLGQVVHDIGIGGTIAAVAAIVAIIVFWRLSRRKAQRAANASNATAITTSAPQTRPNTPPTTTTQRKVNDPLARR